MFQANHSPASPIAMTTPITATVPSSPILVPPLVHAEFADEATFFSLFSWRKKSHC